MREEGRVTETFGDVIFSASFGVVLQRNSELQWRLLSPTLVATSRYSSPQILCIWNTVWGPRCEGGSGKCALLSFATVE